MARYIYGLDPGSKHDPFGIVIHKISDYNPDKKTIPILVTLRKLVDMPYDEILDIIRKELFSKYRPYYIVSDYTNEKSFTDFLIERFGTDKVEKVTFSTSSKAMLKDDGRAILKIGYKFQNPKSVKDSKLKEMLVELIQQLKNEQILTTKSGKTTFDHPRGEHNDLAIAWELSIHGCRKFLPKVPSTPVVVTTNYKFPDRRFYTNNWDPVPELRDPGITITDVITWFPS